MQLASMLSIFSNQNPESVTQEAVYMPTLPLSSTLAISTRHIPINNALISNFRNAMIESDFDHIWRYWMDGDESFDDFVTRVQTVHGKAPDHVVTLMDPDEPKWTFPQFVSHFFTM